jgi:hypothetical protein
LRFSVSDLRRHFPKLSLNVPGESFAFFSEVPAHEQTAEPIDKRANGDHPVREIGTDRANQITSISAFRSQ